MGDLCGRTADPSIEIVGKGYGLETPARGLSEIFNRRFLPPVERGAFAVEIMKLIIGLAARRSGAFRIGARVCFSAHSQGRLSP